jgi:molecular chaperone GrpE
MNKDEEIKYEADLSAEVPAGAEADKKVKKAKDKLKICEQERAEYLAGWQRAKADLINYKREQEQKISEIFRFANEGLIFEILPILDSFEAALKHKNDEGIKQLYNQLLSILKNNGLEEIKAIGEKFNPELHESVGEAGGKEQGIVVEEVQKGYKLNGKVIRASKVKINK